MTVNHFLITRGGLTLDGAPYAPLVQGAGPVTRDVTDNRLGMRVNLIPNPSAEVDTSGWTPYWSGGAGTLARLSVNPASGAHSFRLLPNGAGTTIRMAMAATASVDAGKTYTLQFSAKGVNGAPGVAAVKCDLSFDGGAVTTYTLGTISGSQVAFSKTFAAPAGVSAVTLAPVFDGMTFGSSDAVFVDALLLEVGSTPAAYFDGDSAGAAWAGTPHASASSTASGTYDAPSTITGVPGDLAGVRYLWHGTSADIDNPPEMTMPWPGGFYRSVFRVARDPFIVTDDSGQTLGTQIYSHGWVLADRLAAYFKDVHPDELVWPLPSDLAVVPVTGTAATTDSKGWNGMQAMTWPGSSVGVGMIRQILAGDEGSTRQVGVILDRLAALSQAGRDSISAAFTPMTPGSATQTAMQNLLAAAGTDDGTTTQKRFWARAGLNAMLAKSAVGVTPNTDCTGNSVGLAAAIALCAVNALEAGLVGATFTSADYQTLTDAIDAAIAMPSGY